MAKTAKCDECGIRWKVHIMDQTPLREMSCSRCGGPVQPVKKGSGAETYELQAGEPDLGPPRRHASSLGFNGKIEPEVRQVLREIGFQDRVIDQMRPDEIEHRVQTIAREKEIIAGPPPSRDFLPSFYNNLKAAKGNAHKLQDLWHDYHRRLEYPLALKAVAAKDWQEYVLQTYDHLRADEAYRAATEVLAGAPKAAVVERWRARIVAGEVATRRWGLPSVRTERGEILVWSRETHTMTSPTYRIKIKKAVELRLARASEEIREATAKVLEPVQLRLF